MRKDNFRKNVRNDFMSTQLLETLYMRRRIVIF